MPAPCGSKRKEGRGRNRWTSSIPTRSKPLFEWLKTGLEERIRHAKGEITLKTTTLEVPDRPPDIGAKDVTRIRLN
jgi:hypothetical protein